MKSRYSANDTGLKSTASKALRACLLGSFALVLTTALGAHDASAAKRVQVSTIDVEGDQQQRTVRIRTGAKPTFTVFKLSDPMRVVIDISGGDVSSLDGPMAVEDGVIDQIATRQFSSGGLYVGRVIIGFVHSVFYNVVAEENAVVLTTGERSTPGVVDARPAPEAPVDPKERASLESLKSEASEALQKANEQKRQAEQNKREAIASKRAAEQAQAKVAAERKNVEELKTSVREQAAQALRAQKRAEREAARLSAEKEKLATQAEEVEETAAQVSAAKAQLSLEKERVAEESAELHGKRQALERKEAKANAKQAEIDAAARQVQQAQAKAEQTRREAERDQRIAAEKLEAIEARERAVAAKQKALAADSGPSALKGVHRQGSGLEASVLLDVEGRPTLEVERIENPPRLVIDMYETKRKTKRSVFGIKSPFVRRVRLGEHEDKLRAVFDLRDTNARHEVTRTAEGIVVSMRPSATAPEQQATGGPDVTGVKALEDVQFTRDGKVARIALKVALDELPKVDTRSSKAWVLNLENTKVTKALEKSLDTTAYDTVVRLISTYQANDEPPMVKIVANLEGPAKHRLRQEGDVLIWELTDDTSAPAVARSSAPQTAGFAAEAAAVARAVPKQTRAKKKKKRISLDLQDAEVVSVLRLLSEVSGENIIASDAVSGTVTLRLRNVPWDQALDTILKTKGFARVRQNNIIRIAPAAVIQAEQEAAVARKKLREESEPTAIKLVTVNYAVASEIIEQLKPLLSERGNVQTDDRTNTIIV
ncbi:MAG: AMIN domain-containing protein [Myxococcota bacterium]|nr:AMIN domain-containing protein [Myxococcota bacterium]